MMAAVWLHVTQLSAAISVRFGWEDHTAITFMLAFCIPHTIVFWGLTLFYECLRRSPWRRYIIQPELARPSPALLRECLANALLNHVLLQWLSAIFLIAPMLQAAGALEAFGAPLAEALYDVSSVWQHVWRLGFCFVVEDSAFYWIHRALHHRAIYALVHKRHHAFISAHPLGSEHAHLLETLVGNLLPYYLGFALLSNLLHAPAHGTTFMIWTWMRIAESCDGHSGFELPLLVKMVVSPFSLGQHRAVCKAAPELSTSTRINLRSSMFVRALTARCSSPVYGVDSGILSTTRTGVAPMESVPPAVTAACCHFGTLCVAPITATISGPATGLPSARNSAEPRMKNSL